MRCEFHNVDWELMTADFHVAGVSHTSAPFEHLSRLSVSEQALPNALVRGARQIGEAVLLSTCNRTEAYSIGDPDTHPDRLVAFLESLDHEGGTPDPALRRSMYVLSGDRAVRHLFRVTSGLESLVIGEPEIVNQVTRALRVAGEQGAVSHQLSRLFHHALRTARKVRSETEIGRRSLSVSAIGIDLLKRHAGDLGNLNVLLVGVGETGKLAARALRRQGAKSLAVASRRPERAAEAAAELGGRAIEMSALAQSIANADAIVTCTSAESTVISHADVVGAMRGRAQRPLFILDLAIPPDVEPAAREVPGVHLYDLDSLKGIAAEHRQERQAAAKEAEAVIEAEIRRFREGLVGIEAEPAIKALGERAEAARRYELDRALRRMPDLSEQELRTIEAMSRALVKRILAAPITYLRAPEDPDAIGMVARAFDLPTDASGPQSG